MADNTHYWNNKESRAERAKHHTELMEKMYGPYIQNSVNNTHVYGMDKEPYVYETRKTGVCPETIVANADTVSAILASQDLPVKVAALNFASYKNPGGMFLNGSKAQEECLCHESFLYNVLSKKEEYYKWNNQNKNKALYLNRALYSPDILFYRKLDNKKRACDVITCAAPNYTAAAKYQGVTLEENTKVLESRIQFVLDIAEAEQVEILILGAFGCGVFGQNPVEVANLFKKHLEGRNFKQVVFAVPGDDINYTSFRDVFDN